jgi:hypothetical protein
MNVGTSRLGQRIQTQKDIFLRFYLHQISLIGKFIEPKSKSYQEMGGGKWGVIV